MGLAQGYPNPRRYASGCILLVGLLSGERQTLRAGNFLTGSQGLGEVILGLTDKRGQGNLAQ